MSGERGHDFRGTERFSIEERIGHGATGVVYRARDNERGADVALKLLKRFDPMALYRFKQEFRALADVSHPNLVSLFELVSAGEQWFFTMELVEGSDFLKYVRFGPGVHDTPTGRLLRFDALLDAPASDDTADTLTLPVMPTATASGSLTNSDGVVELASARHNLHIAPPATGAEQLDRLRAVLIQLADGVAALHDAGQLHRDIKPSNVLVTDEQRVVVLDFGVVAELTPHGAATDAEARLVGTPAYMAPEQAGGGGIGPHSDWYSLGVMMYEALAGRRPFVGAARDVIAAKQSSDPRPPSAFAADVPAELDSLCMRLMSRDPAARPSGGELIEALGGGTRSSQPLAQQRAAHPDRAFVGRGAHLEMLRAAYTMVRTGQPRTALVHGSSGMGKTALVEHFLAELRADGEAVVLTGRCFERESVPYKALDDLIDALSRHLAELPRREVWDMMPRDVYALARLFPVLRRVEAVLGAARQELSRLEPHELRRRAFDALRELLERLAERAPLVLFIDDVQWGDSDSAALLAHVMRPLSAPPIMLLAAYRREDAGTSPLLRALLPAQQSALSLSVDPLTREESERLALSLLGDDHEIARNFARSISRESSGNPFFVDELVRFVRDHQGGGHVSIGSDVTLDTVLSSRIADLSDDARALLEAVAVAGRPVSQALAIRSAELGAHEQPALAALRAANLVHTRGTRDSDEIECLHDRVRVTVLASMSAEQLRDMHARLASIFASSGEGDEETLSIHFEGAGDLERASMHGVAAADAAAEALAFGRAAELYRRVLKLGCVSGDEEVALRGHLGDALANAGRRAEAAAEYRAAARSEHAAERFELGRRAAEAYLCSGHVDEGVRALDEVLRGVGLTIPRTPRRAVLSALLRRAWVRIRGLGYRERDRSELTPFEIARVNVLYSASVGFAMCDLLLGVDFQARHVLAALRAGDRYSVVRALAAEGAFRSVAGLRGRKRALRIAEHARELAEGLGDRLALAWANESLGLIAYQVGRFAEARTLTEKALAMLSGRYEASWESVTVKQYRAWALYYLGEGVEFQRFVSPLVEEAEARGDLYSVTNLSTGIPNSVWLMRDDVDGARVAMREAMDRWSRQGFHLQHYWHFLSRASADLYAGAGEQGWRNIEREWHQLERSMLRRVSMVRIESDHARARMAILAAHQGVDRERLLRLAEKKTRKAEREKLAFTAVLAATQRAGIAAVRGDLDAAGVALAAAVERAEAAEMAMYAAAARWRLGVLRGGDEGAALVAAGRACFDEQQVRSPERFVRHLIPGFDD